MRAADFTEKLAWVKTHTPFTQEALARLPLETEINLSIRFHIDLKMIPVVEKLSRHFSLQVFPCHQDTTDPEGWAYLVSQGLAKMEAEWSKNLCYDHLSSERSYLCDLGGEMIEAAILDKFPVTSAIEGTTSGLNRIALALQKNEVAFPIFDWNSAPLKREIHNEKMVGFSLWQTFTDLTQLSLHAKTVGILGFGAVGRGISRTARALGGNVLVYDQNPEAELKAKFEGFACPGREQVLLQSNVLVTATGSEGALTLSDLEQLQTACFLLNAGHSELEIDQELREYPGQSEVLPGVDALSYQGKTIYLLAGGRLLNLAAGFGDTINAFDVTSAQLVDAIGFMLKSRENQQPGLQKIPNDFFRI